MFRSPALPSLRRLSKEASRRRPSRSASEQPCKGRYPVTEEARCRSWPTPSTRLPGRTRRSASARAGRVGLGPSNRCRTPHRRAGRRSKAAQPREAVIWTMPIVRPRSPKPAEPDDLQLISGVGPKIEGILNESGHLHLRADCEVGRNEERDWVDGYLRFSGRIDRDDWIRQAKALAKGGRDEYVRVFGKEPR